MENRKISRMPRFFHGFLFLVWVSSIGNSMEFFSNMGAFHRGGGTDKKWNGPMPSYHTSRDT